MNDKNDKIQSPHKTPSKRQEATIKRIAEAVAGRKDRGKGKQAERVRKALQTAEITAGSAEAAQSAKRTLGRALAAHTTPIVRTRRWQTVVIEALCACPNFTYAAKLAGVARETILKHRQKSPAFAERVQLALEQGAETLEMFCWQRATQGVPKPIFGRDAKGNPCQVGTVTEYSDRLAEVMLKAHLRDKYNPPQQTELSGPNGAPLAPIVAPTQVQIIIPDNGRSAPQLPDAPPALPDSDSTGSA